jgi:tripartite-type tricarboxylate transporter receptor subunit TctC
MRSIVAAVALWLVPCASAPAQDYPTRTVRIIIPLGPGGGGDVFTRALADELQKALRQPVVVENGTGGALNIGTRACAEAPPDGYTICVLSSEPVIYNQFLFKSLPFDPDKDFAPISNLFFNTLALFANNSLKVRTIPDLVALAKARPGTLSYGTFSFPLAHFMEKLKKETGADIVRVPFRSGSEVVTAVLSGSTPVAILALSNMVPQLQSGHITGLVVMSRARSPLFPDVPTLAEARNGESYPSTWFGLFAPAGTRSRSSPGSRARSRGSSRSRISAGACSSIAPWSPRMQGSTTSRASSARNARSPTASSASRDSSRNSLARRASHPDSTMASAEIGGRLAIYGRSPALSIPHNLHSASSAILARSTAAA